MDDTSTVTVSDPDATDGYLIKAKLTADIATNFTVQIWSDASTFCTEANKCTLTTADKNIYTNFTDSAVQEPADDITFNVRIVANMSTPTAQHDIDIDYTKELMHAMQSFTTDKCDALTPFTTDDTELNLYDKRDEKFYKVRKLADGNCWMVDNLALDGSQTIDSTTSDIASNYTLPATVTPNGQTYCYDLNTAVYANKCGNHYAWTTATAGSAVDSNGVSAEYSICPKNWRLPINGEYATLRTDLNWGNNNDDSINNSAWRGLYAGSNTSSNVGVYGLYWTATANSSTHAYRMYYYLNSVDAGNGSVKTNQFPVRCLVK